MKPFTTHQGLVIAIDRANIDTDAIIPKQFLTSIHKTGFGVNLFDEWRYEDYGKPGMDNSQRPLNPNFPLNQERFKGGSILLARENFGCGSSREHAVWALDDFGIRAVISSSYSDIFYNNCFKNGVLPIRLSAKEIDQLFKLVEENVGLEINIDLEAQSVTPQLAGKSLTDAMHFEIDSFRKNMLVNGLDDISLTLQHEADIKAYETRRKEVAPWLFS